MINLKMLEVEGLSNLELMSLGLQPPTTAGAFCQIDSQRSINLQTPSHVPLIGLQSLENVFDRFS